MSPHNDNSTTAWDPGHLRLSQETVARTETGNRRPRRRSTAPGIFIAGPVDVAWVLQAGRLGVKALLVGLLLWHLRGLKRSDTFKVSNMMAERWGVTPDAKGRALRKLEAAGLIAVERQGKRSPRVTLLVQGRSATPRTVSPIVIQAGGGQPPHQ
jgi:DNA-binding transcriptional ArsR family regulator